jgi:hypothetical protein
MNVIEVVQAFDGAPITALKTDDASALESKLSAAARLFVDRKSWLKPNRIWADFKKRKFMHVSGRDCAFSSRGMR